MSELYKGPQDPLWYKDAIIYELHVRAFADSDGDGIGDFRGLTEKLDYLEDLGVNTLWLLPFYPSPLKDDGYDISDYTSIHPSYGTLADFKVFMREAHRRGLRVVTELVVNHTSDQHPWFQRARRAPPGDSRRDWYVWSGTPELYRDARVIFGDFEPSNWSWDAVAKAYYWHRFYAHQPDLNFEHPEVHQAILGAADFWLEQGVDGFRLDAIPYLYEREGTPCENLPETHAFLKKLRKHIDARHPHRLLLAEANQWPEDAAAYFGSGDECNMAFHFPIMTRLFLAVHMEDRYPMVDILTQTPALPESAQWALFLRNHDELTLEMVTDQERDYMYRVYAQDRAARINLGIRRRLAPLLQNNRRKIELLNALLFSLPGTPVIYYGDEIGMGDNIFLGDRNGVRTPMQWSGDRNAGFSRANAQQLYLPVIVDPEYHYEALNVEAQQANPHSLLWWTKRLLALSRRFKAFGRGTFELLSPENRKVLAFLRRYEEEVILVVANLSRFAQAVELDLRALKGRLPVELFGRTPFPKVGEAPYLLTLGPHSFFWFSLEQPHVAVQGAAPKEPLKTLEVGGVWTDILSKKPRQALEPVLQSYLRGQSWFSGRWRSVRSFRIVEAFPLPLEGVESALILAHADYEEGEGETYSIPLCHSRGDAARKLRENAAPEVVAGLRIRGSDPALDGVLHDALADETFLRAWVGLMAQGAQLRAPSGSIAAVPFPGSDPAGVAENDPVRETPQGEPRRGTLTVGGRFHLKWYRQMQEGNNPELEVAQYLAPRRPLAPVRPWIGHWEYLRKAREPLTLAALQEAVPPQQNGWSYTQDELGRYFEAVRALPSVPATFHAPRRGLQLLLTQDPPAEIVEIVGPYLESVRKMGECTARLHRALAADPESADFAPQPFLAAHLPNAYQALRRKVSTLLPLLGRAAKILPPPRAAEVERVLGLETTLLKTLQALLKKSIGTLRIRCHGDLNLHELFSTGSEFIVLDLSGPATSPFIERRIRRSPLWDVAAMLRSFHEAAYVELAEQEARGEVAVDRWKALEEGAAAWYGCVASAYVKSYRATLADSRLGSILPESIEAPLRLNLLEKTIDRISSALLTRTDRIPLILRGLVDLLEDLEEPRPATAPPS